MGVLYYLACLYFVSFVTTLLSSSVITFPSQDTPLVSAGGTGEFRHSAGWPMTPRHQEQQHRVEIQNGGDPKLYVVRWWFSWIFQAFCLTYGCFFIHTQNIIRRPQHKCTQIYAGLIFTTNINEVGNVLRSEISLVTFDSLCQVMNANMG